MKPHYDFSNGVRGKFYQPDATFRLPIYLDAGVESYLAMKANSRGIELSELVNDLLRREIAILEAQL